MKIRKKENSIKDKTKVKKNIRIFKLNISEIKK